MQTSSAVSLSPSFNGYSNSNLAEIAARVVEELRAENEMENDFFVDDDGRFSCFESGEIFAHNNNVPSEISREESRKEIEKDKEAGDEDEDDDEFEFSFVKESEFSPISADEIFSNGQIRPVYPIFDKSLLLGNRDFVNTTSSEEVSTPPATIRLPLRKLFNEEREANSSCSSSEADDLEAIPPGTYCVWRPKAVTEESAGGCKKSNSTGSSKRWKFRDLLHRSNSDGKDTFVFLTPSFKKRENKVEKTTADHVPKVAGKGKGSPAGESFPAMHYVKNGGDKRKSYLPYRQDLVGFFANMNGVSRNLQPF